MNIEKKQKKVRTKWGNVIRSSLLLSLFFSLPCFLSISPFLLLLPCLVACFVVYVLVVGCFVGCWVWMGKGVAFTRFLGLIRKKRKLYMVLVMLSLGFSGTFCICCVTFFLFYLICLYWIVLKNNQCYCPLYLDK